MHFRTFVNLFLCSVMLCLWSLTQSQSFDRKAMLSNIASVILSCHQEALYQATLLDDTMQAFVQNPSAESLSKVQQQWKHTGYAWSQCEFYEIGGLEVMILHNQINKAPNHSQIEKALASSETTINAAFLEKKGSSMKGLGALEFFLFYPEAELENLQNPRRLAYMSALSQNLKMTLENLVAYWDPTGNNYTATFIAADQADGSIKGSINMLMNELINSLEKVAREKIAKPLGDVATNLHDAEASEAFLSQTSLDRIRGNILSGQRMFSGADGSGIDDYLRFLGSEKLVSQIDDQFDAVLEAIGYIDEPLETAITTQPERVNQVLNSIKSLLILISVDAANQLGITVTFNDSDGD